MTYQEIKSFINTYIVQNGVNAITGAQLNTILNELADYKGFDSVFVTTLPAGSDATVTVQGMNLVLGIPKGADGRDGQNAVNPFKGWYTTDNIPTTGQEGDYCNVSDTSVTPPTVTIYRWDDTQESFVDTGEVPDTATGETFASGETLQEVAIDDSHLVNPVNTADPTKPVLAKAEDVMQLKAKLEGVKLREEKVVINSSDVEDSNYINGDTGKLANPSTTDNKVLTINVANANKVRFLSVLLKAAPSANGSGYAFWNSNNAPISEAYSKWDYDTSLAEHSTKEYLISVPEGAVLFKLTLPLCYSVFTMDNFYCYLQSGKSVIEMIPDVVDNLNSTATDKSLSANMGKNIGSSLMVEELSGNDDTSVFTRVKRVIPNHTYRISLANPDVPKNNITYTTESFFILAISVSINGSSDFKYLKTIGADMKEFPFDAFYDIVIPDGYQYLRMSLKFNVGETEIVQFKDITSEIDIDDKISSDYKQTLIKLYDDGDNKNLYINKYIYAKGQSYELGSILTTSSDTYVFLADVENFESVRFLGRITTNNALETGYCFYDSNLDTDTFSNAYENVVDKAHSWRIGTKNEIVEYNVEVPKGAKYLGVSLQNGGLVITTLNRNTFYCYGINGKTVSSELNELNIKIKSINSNNEYYSFRTNTLIKGEILNDKWYVRDGYYHYKIKVNEGDIIKVSPLDGSSSRVAFLPLNYEVVDDAPVQYYGGTNSYSKFFSPTEFVAPAECSMYIQVGSRNYTQNPYPFCPKEIVITPSTVNKYSDTWVEAPFSKRSSNIKIDSNGNLIGGNGNEYVKYYDINPNTPYRIISIHSKNLSSNYICAFYSSSWNFLGGIANQGDSTTIRMDELIIPSDTAFAVLSYYYNTSSNYGGAFIMEQATGDIKQYSTDNSNTYFVSKIRIGYMPNEYTNPDGDGIDQHENITRETWSAWAMRLPKTYSKTGKKTQLVAWFHGTSGYVNEKVMGYKSWDTYVHKKLLDAGFAVMDIHGYGIGFDSDVYSQHWGCPGAVDTVKKAFDYLRSNYNIGHQIILGGLSMGGAICTTYAKTYPSDVIAIGVMAPTNLLFTCLWQGGGESSYIHYTGVAWGYEGIEAMRADNASHIVGYAPLAVPYYVDENNVVKKMTEFPSTALAFRSNNLVEPFPVPMKIWHSVNDNNVPFTRTQCLVDSIRRAGGNAMVRKIAGPLSDPHDLPLYPYIMDEVIEYYKSISNQ